MNKVLTAVIAIGLLSWAAAPAHAQTIKNNVRQKASWYNAPREVQIIDERPVVRDFREAPSSPGSIQLPPGPMGGQGVGGGGAGALGGDDGGVLPANGLQIPGGGPGYRTPQESGPVALPHADLGHQQSNIPARGMGPRGPLPGGYTTGVHAKMSAPTFNPATPMAGNMGRRAAAPVARSIPTATYSAPGAGYGPSVGSGSGGGGANTSVSGRLLKKVH